MPAANFESYRPKHNLTCSIKILQGNRKELLTSLMEHIALWLWDIQQQIVFDVQVTVHRDKFLFKNQLDALISQFFFWNKTLQERTGSGRNCISVLILLASCQQSCMTYTIAVCTVKSS